MQWLASHLLALLAMIRPPAQPTGWPGYCPCTKHDGSYIWACHLRVAHPGRKHLDRSRGEWQDG